MIKKSKKILLLFISLIITIGSILSLETISNAATDMSISYNTHIQNIGWEADFSKSNGQSSGTSGQSLRLEAIKIKLNNAPSGINLKYQVHVENEGWQGWKSNGEMAGTSGKSYRLEAIKIKLEGTKNYKVQYRTHVQYIGWQDWREDGEIAGTTGQSLRLEAIQIRIVKVDSPVVEYNSHVEFNGWEPSYSKSNGQTSGTTGQNLGLQALQVKLSGVPINANIQCQAHVQYQGWKNWANEGTIAGTTGLGLNLEAIKLRLNNLPGYSIQYRAHVQYVGWQDWKKDGEIAGTTGQNLRIEAIQIKLVRTDNVKPVITLKGNSTVNVRLGDKYVDAGATALDNIDGNITSKIITKSNVNTLKVGTYTVSYTVSDKAGNVDTKTRTVKVFDYMTGIEITKPTKKEYNYGEDLNLYGLSVKAVMKSGNKTNVAINNCKITGYNKNKLGNQTVTVSYNEKIATFQVTVKDYITNLEIVEPTKTEYNYGEDLNLYGLSVKAVMKSGNKTNVAINNCKITGYNKNKLGNQTVTVSYNEKIATFQVTVKDYITNLEIVEPTKKEYNYGEDLNLSGLYVKAVMKSGNKTNIAINNCKITGYNKNKLGNQTVTVSYNEKIATFQVTVKDYITNLEIVEPTKKEYNYGEDLNLSGLSVKAVMKSGNKTNITINNCKITGYDKNKIGDQTVTVNYGEKAATFKVRVNNYVTGIEIAKKPTKNQYIEGERIDLTGLVVNAVMADKTKIDVTDKITTVPSAEVLYKTETVYVSYTTTNTIDKTSKTFECEFPVTVNKAFSKIVINQEKNTGYAHEEFIYGTISSGEGEETIKIANLKYQIKDESGKDITTDGLVKVTFETEVARPEEILIKVTAEKIGKYTIVAYVGENINDSNVIKSEEQQIEISCSQVVKTAEILDFVDANVRINKTIIKDIKFTNAYGDELTNVANNEISIIGDGVKITFLDETGKPGSIVRKLQIQGIQEGTTNIKIILNKGTENETQPISLGNITVQAKAKEMLNIGSLTQIKLLQEKPEESISNVIVVNEIPYSLIPIKLVDEDNIERKIKANEFVLGDATSENKFGVKYTGYDPNELIPLLDIQMFKDRNIVNSSSSLQEIDAIGIALTEGTTQEELKNKDIILQYYGSSAINLKMEVEELKIKSLVIIPENVDNVSKLPKVENHIKTTIGTIKPGEDNRTLNISDLNYQVKDENGKDITNSMINGKKMIKVTFESEVARPGEILINVETQKEGNYTIIPYIEISSNKIFTEQEIESVNNPVVNNVELPELSTAQLEVNTPFESTIIFKNSYGDILNVSQNTIEVTGADLTITLLEGTSPVDPDNGEQNVTGIQVFAQSAGSKTLSITVNKGTTDEKTVKIQIVVANVATVQLNIGGMNKIYLYENKPETTDYITSVISEDATNIVYTLIPISLSDGTKLRGNCLANNKLMLTISNDDELSIDVKMFKDKNTISEDGEEVEYIGIALGMGYEESELIGETITLRYGSSIKTLKIGE